MRREAAIATCDLAAPLMTPAETASNGAEAVPMPRRQKTISPSEAVVHLMKGNLGPGVLALPLQFVRVGAPLGLAVLAVVGMQGVYCMWLIVVTQHAVQRQGRGSEIAGRRGSDPLSFEDLGQVSKRDSGEKRCFVPGADRETRDLSFVFCPLAPPSARLWARRPSAGAGVRARPPARHLLRVSLARRREPGRRFGTTALGGTTPGTPFPFISAAPHTPGREMWGV